MKGNNKYMKRTQKKNVQVFAYIQKIMYVSLYTVFLARGVLHNGVRM